MSLTVRDAVRYSVTVAVVIAAGVFTVRALLPNPTHSSSTHRTLHDAVRKGDPALLNQLIDKGADPNATNEHGYAPLHLSYLRIGRPNTELEITESLLRSGADPNARDRRGDTALMAALEVPMNLPNRAERRDVVEALLAHGADVNAKNDLGWSPLARAAMRRFEEAIPLLLEGGAERHIFEAVLLGDKERTLELINEDPGRVNEELPNWITPLMLAALQCDVDLARTLLDRGAFVDAQARSGLSPLHFGVLYEGPCSSEMMKLLLMNGADPNLPAVRKRETPFHYACKDAPSEVVRELLEGGAQIDLADEDGHTGLMLAAGRRDPGGATITQLLVDAGADANARAVDGATALFFARNATVLEILLEGGADPNARNDTGSGVLSALLAQLSWRVASVQPDLIRPLLEHGLDPNGSTHKLPALFFFVQLRNAEIVELMVEYGADPLVLDPKGQTPIDVAESSGMREIAQIMSDHVAEKTQQRAKAN